VAADTAGDYETAIPLYEETLLHYRAALKGLPTTEETWRVASHTLEQYEKRISDLREGNN
jgi:hypothetical protein